MRLTHGMQPSSSKRSALRKATLLQHLSSLETTRKIRIMGPSPRGRNTAVQVDTARHAVESTRLNTTTKNNRTSGNRSRIRSRIRKSTRPSTEEKPAERKTDIKMKSKEEGKNGHEKGENVANLVLQKDRMFALFFSERVSTQRD